MILDLRSHPECDLEVYDRFRLELATFGIWRFLVGSGNFDIGVGMEFQQLDRSVVSFVTCVQNLRLFGSGLVSFGVICEIWKFRR